jgi:hypothetical protein
MKKVQMEHDRNEYASLMRGARSAMGRGDYREAIDTALSSWPHIDGMMRYEGKYADAEFSSVDAIDLVLKYAPLILDFGRLDKLEELLKDQRRIEKRTSTSLADKLCKARELMWHVHTLWDHLEFHPGTRQDELSRHLGGDQGRWRSLAERLESMGLLSRASDGRSYRLDLCTRMGQLSPAKCPACGGLTEAPKAMLLEETTCPNCRTKVTFVLISPEARQASGG